MENPAVPLHARVQLAHAAVQAVADQAAARVLHIKGPTVAEGLREHRSGSDVDIIVRPTDVDPLLRALADHGWVLETPFTSSSAFDHAANLRHDTWGLVDVHRTYPGLGSDPGRSFEILWRDRGTTAVANREVPVPSVTAQRLVLLLHAARTPSGTTEHPDVTRNWSAATTQVRHDIEELADELDATVGLAAARGALDDYASHPEAALWRSYDHPDDRLGQWRARIRAAPRTRDKLSLTWRSIQVNRYYLSQDLGRPATGLDVAQAWVARLGSAASALRTRIGGGRS